MNNELVWESVLEAVQNPVVGTVINFKWGFMANPEEREKWDGSFLYTEKGWVASENHSQTNHDFSQWSGLRLYNQIVEFSSGKDCCVQVTLLER